ncbi:MAG: efflux RND transporter permease subunit [Gammaproteobacteria bacterium]|nr:MAG: efflux RND transporter permease subunit [Gammaproteobacteria bacterium]
MHVDQTRQGIIAWFARNSVAANLLMWFVLVAGLVSYFGINKRMFPEFQRNWIVVSVALPGAAPADVEQGVILKIEDAIRDVNGIEQVRSSASEGFGMVRVEVDNDFDLNEVLNEIKMRVDAISTFPDQAEKPIVAKEERTNQVLWLALYGDMDRRSRQTLADEIRDEIAALPSVNQVSVVGKRPYEMTIEIDQNRLLKYGLTISDITNAIRRSSLDLPAGSLKTKGGDIRVRTLGQAYTGQEFANIVVRTTSDGTELKLSDVATIRDGFVESDEYSHFDGKPVTSIQVLSIGDQNDIEIAEDVKRYVEQKRKTLPKGVNLEVWGDTSYYLKGRLDMMWSNLFQGAILVFLILTLFLRVRLAFWVMLGIPISFMGAFLVMPNLGPWAVSINLLSLFAFILVLGIVVDDAIVIGESIYTTIKKDGQSVDNVIIGAQRVATPATFGVLTTIAAFAPTLFIDVGPSVFFTQISIIVSLCLLFSLMESKLILPAHLAHMKFKPYDPKSANAFERFQHAFRDGFERFVQTHYRRAVGWTTRWRYPTIATFFGLVIMASGLVTGGLVRTEIFPTVPSDFIQVNVVLNDGASVAMRDNVLSRVEQAAYKISDEWDKTHPEEGGFLKHIMLWTNGDTGGNVFMELTKAETRSINAFEIERRWRRAVGELPGVKEVRFFAGTNVGGGAALSFKLTGRNYDQLERAASQLMDRLKSYEGVYDVRSSFSSGTQEIKLKIKPEAEPLGLTQLELGRQVRQAIYGDEAQRIQRGRDEVKVMVRYPRELRQSLYDLKRMWIRTPSGQAVPLMQVAELEMGAAYSTISRQDGARAIRVMADINPDKVESDQVLRDVYRNVLPEILKDYPAVKAGLTGASEARQELGTAIAKAFALSLFLIYVLLAVPLKSYSQPLIVMSVIPFGVIGAIIGHYLMGFSLSMMSLFGIVALGGVVVNDSLLLVDFVNRARDTGTMSVVEAVQEGACQRFRAVVLTSLTTFAGLLPIYFEKSLQAQFIIPMAISLGMGILFATVITLFLVPALYATLEDFKRWVKTLRGSQPFAMEQE